MRSVVLHCPHLGRDLAPLYAAIPGLLEHVGLPTPRGEDGCLESHKTIIREAMDAGADRVFVLEDDCAVTSNFDLARWTADADWAATHGYDVLAGGCTLTYAPRLVRAGLIEVAAFHSAHCVVYFQSGYAKALQAVQPYDVSLGRDCGLRCLVAWPFVAVQRPSFSGILQKPVDYVPDYLGHQAALGVLTGAGNSR
jgi:hypothetical protein